GDKRTRPEGVSVRSPSREAVAPSCRPNASRILDRLGHLGFKILETGGLVATGNAEVADGIDGRFVNDGLRSTPSLAITLVAAACSPSRTRGLAACGALAEIAQTPPGLRSTPTQGFAPSHHYEERFTADSVRSEEHTSELQS